VVTGQSLYFCSAAAGCVGPGVAVVVAGGRGVEGEAVVAVVVAEELGGARGLELEYYPERLPTRRTAVTFRPFAPQPRHWKCCASHSETGTVP